VRFQSDQKSKYLYAIVVWLLERGLEFLGIQSVLLTIGLWCIAAGIAAWALWRDLASHKKIRLVVMLLMLALAVVALVIVTTRWRSFPTDVNQYIKAWGFVGDGGSLFVRVDTTSLEPYADSFSLVAAALLDDSAIDFMKDRRLQKSAAISITRQTVRIEIRVDKEFIERINSMRSPQVKFYLCLLPNKYRPDQISQLGDVFSLGGHVIGHRGVGTTQKR
jgi:hypothetical protein